MNYNDINWNTKDIDEVYEFIDNLEEDKKHEFFKWLYTHHPDLELEWLDTFEDIRFKMSHEDNIVACEEFVLWYSEKFPDEYSHRYEFIERDLCDYYFFTKNYDKLRERIKIIAQNPVSGIDTITIRLFYQLLYHGLYSDAIQYAQQVYPPLYDDDTLWGNPEQSFMQALYIDSLQTAYQHFKETGKADFSHTLILAEKFKLEENEKIFKMESEALQNALDSAHILNLTNTNPNDCIQELNVHFLKYMLDNHAISFVLSEFLWSIVGVKNLFGKSKFSDDFFYVDAGKFEETLTKRIDYALGSNSLEMFGKIWALHYVYEFLEANRLISADAAVLMHENNLYHRNEMIRYMSTDLWQMNFVFIWPNNKHWKYLEPIFNSTFDISYEETLNIIETFNQSHPISQLLRNELKAENTNQTQVNVLCNDGKPIVNSSPNIGRNDPCPCGSGKKYKKCCFGKSES